MSDYEIFAILLRVIELVLIANLYKNTKKQSPNLFKKMDDYLLTYYFGA